MKKDYKGLEAYRISINDGDFIVTSDCSAMIQLEMVNGVCTSPEWQQQIEWVTPKG